VKISMDGRDRVYDNIFVERLWRTVKYEEVYLHHYEDLDEAWARLGRYFAFYNRERPHQSLGRRTPHEAYFDAREATGGPEIAHAVSTPVALRAPSVATAPHTASSLNHPNSGRDIGKGLLVRRREEQDVPSCVHIAVEHCYANCIHLSVNFSRNV